MTTGVLENIWTIIIILYEIVVAFVVARVVFARRDPVKSLAWILFIITIPVLGVLCHMLFGRNHRKEKLFSRKESIDDQQIEKLARKQLGSLSGQTALASETIERYKSIITLLLNNSRTLLTTRNKLQVLNNGKATFASILETLRGAQNSIHLEYYIFEHDRIGSKIAAILMDKARSGVEVRFIYDDVGSWGLSPKFIYQLRRAGVKVECFMPVVFPWLNSKVNYRNHRKIVVVDGTVAFTGGLNIADRYLLKGRLGKWRDTHLKIEGEGARMLQALFISDWFFVNKKELLTDAKYFPKIVQNEGSPMQIASCGPDSNWATIMQAFFAAITNAKKHIYISSPYFLPNQAILTALKVAAMSGIDVKILIPSKSDSKIVYWATRSYIDELIDAHINVYMYKAGFNHSKLIMIDSEFSSIGTANMDIRSFEDNFEVSALIYDKSIALELETQFLFDLKKSQKIDPQWCNSKPQLHKIYESLSRLLSPLL